MSYKGTSKIVAQVSISCEACGNTFSYNHKLSGYAQKSDEFSAMAAAREQLQKKIDRIKGGDFALIADNKPCPQCGYVQSWMIQPVRKHRGNNWGCMLGAISYVLAILLIGTGLLNNTPLHNNSIGMLLVFVVPIIILLIGRTLAMMLYKPNKGREVPQQTKLPSITFQAP